MLPMVIYITNGIITNWGNSSFKSFGGFNSTSASCLVYYMNMWLGIAFNMFKEVHPWYVNGVLLVVYCILFLTMHNYTSTHM